MAASVSVESATQTSEIGSDDEEEFMFDKNNPTIMASPRVVIDTSPAFASVHEAILRFGGHGFWVPRPLHPPSEPDLMEPEIYSLEDRSLAMLKDLQMKEQETLEILKELEMTKKLVEELKLRLPKETQPSKVDYKDQSLKKDVNRFIYDNTTKIKENSNSFPTSIVELMMMELKQTKLNLNQNTNELATIRASVESLSKKIEEEKVFVGKGEETKTSSYKKEPMKNDTETISGSINPLLVSRGLQELNYEAEQFMKTADAARSEVMKAMSGIEQTKMSLRVIEMRWVAAKKLEEAAKAAESLAFAEIRAFEECKQKPNRISLSFEEYSILMEKVMRSEKRKEVNEPLRRMEETTENRKRVSFDEPIRRVGLDSTQRKPPMVGVHSTLRNSLHLYPRRDSRLIDVNKSDLKPNTSIGDILSNKLVLRDDLDVERQREDEIGRQRVSLNQMLRQQRETSPINMRSKDGGGEVKKFFSKRKALGFVHISLPLSKSSKNKIRD